MMDGDHDDDGDDADDDDDDEEEEDGDDGAGGGDDGDDCCWSRTRSCTLKGPGLRFSGLLRCIMVCFGAAELQEGRISKSVAAIWPVVFL